MLFVPRFRTQQAVSRWFDAKLGGKIPEISELIGYHRCTITVGCIRWRTHRDASGGNHAVVERIRIGNVEVECCWHGLPLTMSFTNFQHRVTEPELRMVNDSVSRLRSL
jgi:hypothetical protein